MFTRLFVCFLMMSFVEALTAQAPQLILQKGHLKSIVTVAFSKDDKYILTASADGTAKTWDPFSGKLVADLAGNGSPLVNAFFSPDGKYLVTIAASERENVYTFWDPATGDVRYRIRQPQYIYETLSISPNGQLLATAAFNQDEITLAYTANNNTYKKIKGFDAGYHLGPSMVKFLSDSTLLISSLKSVSEKERQVIVLNVYNFVQNSLLFQFCHERQSF